MILDLTNDVMTVYAERCERQQTSHLQLTRNEIKGSPIAWRICCCGGVRQGGLYWESTIHHNYFAHWHFFSSVQIKLNWIGRWTECGWKMVAGIIDVPQSHNLLPICWTGNRSKCWKSNSANVIIHRWRVWVLIADLSDASVQQTNQTEMRLRNPFKSK